MFKRSQTVATHDAYAAVPVTMITAGPASTKVAVHVCGPISPDSPALVYVPGYTRNMLDFAEIAASLSRMRDGLGVILIDLPGRGRSAPLPKGTTYSTVADAQCVVDVLTALDVSRAILIGQGHGGQVAMLMAQRRPSLFSAAVLVDSGPVVDPRGLVRLRSNLRYIESARTNTMAVDALRKMLSADYPGESETRLDTLAPRQFRFDRKGRARGLFDPELLRQIEKFTIDDSFEPQWPLFDGLADIPLMLVRTQLTDQVRRETFEEMQRRRPDAASIVISGQGSPALLDTAEEIDALVQFIDEVSAPASGEE